MEYTATPICRGSEVVGSVIAFRDITERLKAEKRLQFTQYAVDNAADVVFWVTPPTAVSSTPTKPRHALSNFLEKNCSREYRGYQP